MQVLTQAIDVENVRRETDGGREFLVAPVVLVRSMWLNGPAGQGDVYLPQKEVEQSTERWENIPAPIDHPTAGGEPISVHDDRADNPVIAEIRDPEPTTSNDKQAVAGELWVDIEAAKEAGREGQRVVNRLENGDAIEVSSAYVPSQIVAGQFDGEHRDRAALGIQPDHVAILPNDKGKCSISDGCGAGAPVAPAANRLLLNWTDDPVSPEGGQGEDAGPPDNSNGMDDDHTPFERLGRKVAASLGLNIDESTGDEPAESGADDSSTSNMGDKTQELVENHGFDAENLPDEDSECFDRIYNAFVDNDDGAGSDADGGGSDGTDDSGAQTTTDDGGVDVEALADELDDKFVTTDDLSDAISEAIATNREHERKLELAEDIVDNSEEYDDAEDVIEDFPTEAALQAKRSEVQPQSAANFAAQTGARASPSNGGTDSFPALSANERAKELEADD